MHARRWLLPLAVTGIAAALWWRAPSATPTLACAFRLGAGTDVHHATQFAKLAADTPFRIAVRIDQPHHVYIFSHSAEDGTLLLFPSPQVKSDQQNPLPPGQSVLPGVQDGKDLAWTTRSGVLATTTVLLLASAAPIPELEALAGKVRRWSNSVFPDRSMQVTLPSPGADVVGKPHGDWPDGLLRATASQLQARTDPNGPLEPLHGHPGVFATSWRFLETR